MCVSDVAEYTYIAAPLASQQACISDIWRQRAAHLIQCIILSRVSSKHERGQKLFLLLFMMSGKSVIFNLEKQVQIACFHNMDTFPRICKARVQWSDRGCSHQELVFCHHINEKIRNTDMDSGDGVFPRSSLCIIASCAAHLQSPPLFPMPHLAAASCSWRDIVTIGTYTQLMIQDWWVENSKIRVDGTGSTALSSYSCIMIAYSSPEQICWSDKSVDPA
jgi:hypothetical protein